MAKLNGPTKNPNKTHEGAPARKINALQALRRAVMSSLLWEDQYYESGEKIAERVQKLCGDVSMQELSDLAIIARHDMKLRHMPLLLLRELARRHSDIMANPPRAMGKYNPSLVQDTIAQVISRVDELPEFLAIYWKDGKRPLSGQVKKGLARAFGKFNEHQFAKYDRDTAIKLRDVLFLCHAKGVNKAQEKLYKKIVERTLKTPDTWEVALSSGEDKKTAWTRLLREQKLGALALLRNLRNMREANVDQRLVEEAIKTADVQHVLPFRFIAAARFAPDLEPALEYAMFKGLEQKPALRGRTIVLVDVSGSMDDWLSAKSDMRRMDAAAGLAMVLRELCEDVVVRTFSNGYALVPNRRGFALRDVIVRSQPHGGTELGGAVAHANLEGSDRLIVITDEQSRSPVPSPKAPRAYMINVASNKHGVGYGAWTHIDGFSEAIVQYILEFEQEG